MALSRFLLRSLIRPQRGSVSMELVLVLPLLFFGLVVTAVAFDGFRARNQTLVATHTVVDLLSRESTMFTPQQLERMNDVYDYLAQTRYPTRMRISSMIWNSTQGRHQLQWSYGTRGLMPLTDEMLALMSTGVVSNWNTVVQLANQLPANLSTPVTGVTGAAGTLLGQINALGGSAAASTLSGVRQVGTNVTNFATGPLGGILGLPEADLLQRVPGALPGEAVIVVESFGRWRPFANVGVAEVRLSPIAVARPRFAPFVHLEGAIPIYPDHHEEVVMPPVGTPSDPNQPPISVTPPNAVQVTVAQQNFAGGDTAGWSRNNTTTIAGRGTVLGLFGNETFGSPVNRSLTLPAGSGRVDIAFDLWVVDSWDGRRQPSDPTIGEAFTIFINGRPISTDLFRVRQEDAFHERSRFNYVIHGASSWVVTMQQTHSGTNFVGGWWEDEIWRVSITGHNPPATLTLGLSARLDQHISDESWGMTNFAAVATQVAPVAVDAPPPTGAIIGTHPGTRFPIFSGCPDPFLGGAALNVSADDLLVSPPAPIANPGNAVAWRGQNGQVFALNVTGHATGAGSGQIWGTDRYTDDSHIATAAVHAGALANGETGVVLLTVEPGQASYAASTRNGVTSGAWGSWSGSYRLQRGTTPAMADRFSFLRQARGAASVSVCPGLPGQSRFDGSALYVMNWNNEGRTGTGNRLRILTDDLNSGNACDAALLIRDPNGQWWYNDNISGSNRNAQLDMGNAQSGFYHVFLGTWAGNTCNTHLVMERY